ncbi:MAG: hypothetical protein RL143_805, partial [Pseudomonadota bacterium]
QGLGASENSKASAAARARHVLAYGMNARLTALSEALRAEYQQPQLNIAQFTLEPACAS